MKEKKMHRNILKHKGFIDTLKNTGQVLIQNFLKSMEHFSIHLELRWVYSYEFP